MITPAPGALRVAEPPVRRSPGRSGPLDLPDGVRRCLVVEAFGLAGQVLVSSRDGVLSSDESTHYAFDASYRQAVLAAFAEPGHVVTQPDPDGGVLHVVATRLADLPPRWHLTVFEVVDDLAMRPAGPYLQVSDQPLTMSDLGRPTTSCRACGCGRLSRGSDVEERPGTAHHCSEANPGPTTRSETSGRGNPSPPVAENKGVPS